VIPLTRALARRRHALTALSREQRADLILAAQPVARGLAMVDRLSGIVRARPLLITLGTAALVVFGPRKLVVWGLRFAPLLTFLRRL
jgi:hypothetical protein